MKIRLSATVFILTILLSGCVTTTPNLDFSLETTGLPALKGSIKNDVYTTKFKKCRFSMDIPQRNNRFELPVMNAREQYTKQYTFVSFGPVPSEKTIYRVMVVEKCQLPLWAFKARNFPLLVDLAAKNYDRHMVKIHEEYTHVNSRPALYEVYVQNMPSVYQYANIKQPSDITLTHAIYYVDYGNYGVIFWIQANSDSGLYPVNNTNRKQVIHGTWLPQVRFIRSFVMDPCSCNN